MFNPETKILVVDPMLAMRRHVMKICNDLGFNNISDGSDGIKAWDALSRANPPFGLIISEWEMPNCTGLDLLKRVRADSLLGKTPFFILSAESEQGEIVKAVQAGVNAYIIKPITTELLKDKIEEMQKKLGSKKV